MSGTLYAVGVGPGDPELLTLKAVRVLRLADVIVCPVKDDRPGVAYRIAKEALPEIVRKAVLPLSFTMAAESYANAHNEAVDRLTGLLQEGNAVVFLTLGDPGFYSTFSYISNAIVEKGFHVETVSGVPSFCAASARLLVPLAAGDEQVLITTEPQLDFPGTIIVMKVGKHLEILKEKAASAARTAYLVENCGMSDERVYRGVDSMPDTTGYFSLMLIKPSSGKRERLS